MKSFTGCIWLLILMSGMAGEMPSQENATPSTTEASPPTLSWTPKVGIMFKAQFLSLSGDQVTFVQDGREIPYSLSRLSPESASQARRLAGLDEPLAPVPVAKPLAMKFEPVSAGRIDTSDRSKGSHLAIDRNKNSYAKFYMGSPPDEVGRGPDEPLHVVRLGRDFYLKATEVTWAEWQSVRKLAHENEYTDLSPGQCGQGGDNDGRHPVLGITWWDAVKWCNLLSQLENKRPVYYTRDTLKIEYVLKTGQTMPEVDWNADGYRLPTEAEWEFACRAAISREAYHTGKIDKTGTNPKDNRNLDQAGWYGGNSGEKTHPVSGKKPNRFGLFDMHGNAAEWCWDPAGVLGTNDVIDPRGAKNGKIRVVRGGSWYDPAEKCRAASRSSQDAAAMPNPSVGFRPARNMPLAIKK